MKGDYAKEIKSFAELDIGFCVESLCIHIEQINVCVFAPGFCYDFHVHSIYEFHYIKEGKGRVIIGDEEYALMPGSFYVTGPGIIHKQVADLQDPMVEYAVSYKLQVEEKNTLEDGSSAEEFKGILEVLKHKAAKVVRDDFGIDVLFERMLLEMRNKNSAYFMEIKNILFQIIIAAVRNFQQGRTDEASLPKRDMDQHRMEVIGYFIADNYSRNIKVEELANHVFLSTRQLERVVRKKTALSVHDYILSFRLEAAQRLLRETALKLSTIAGYTGFSSEFHMSNTFKKRLGMSPLTYRRSHM